MSSIKSTVSRFIELTLEIDSRYKEAKELQMKIEEHIDKDTLPKVIKTESHLMIARNGPGMSISISLVALNDIKDLEDWKGDF